MNKGRQKYWRDASNRLNYVADLPSDKYQSLCQQIVAQFDLKEKSELVVDGLGEIAFQDFESEGKFISLEWDIWSGFMVTAKMPEAEELVQRIGTFIDSTFQA